MSDMSLEEIGAELVSFRNGFQTALLATATVTVAPELSYAPYIRDQNGCFYIYISALAAHTKNVQNNAQVALLFIENEADSKNLFARRRLSYQCNATAIERETTQWITMLDQFTAEFGNIMDVLRGLTDFSLYRLEPESGNYVRGFSQAYKLAGEKWMNCSILIHPGNNGFDYPCKGPE